MNAIVELAELEVISFCKKSIKLNLRKEKVLNIYVAIMI